MARITESARVIEIIVKTKLIVFPWALTKTE